MKWKPDKAPGKKRERKARLKRTQQRKDFVKNMEEADALLRDYERGMNTASPHTRDLEPKFVDWALARYRHDKFGEGMSKQHKNMSKTWLEILQTADACAKATEARTYPKRRAQIKRAAAALRKRRRSGAEM
jgi:hypothetical protein